MNTQKNNDMPAANNGRRKLRNDIIFIVLLLIIISVAGACFYFLRGKGDCVKVMVDGKLYGTYELSYDTRAEIKTGADGLNVLVIKDGKAYVESANCPDGICQNHRPIHRDGESIACLPHRVAITVYARGDAPDIAV